MFWSGGPQALRLPKEFRFHMGEVGIRRVGNAVVLAPVVQDQAFLDRRTGPLDDDFRQAVLEQPGDQGSAELDFVQ